MREKREEDLDAGRNETAELSLHLQKMSKDGRR